MYARGTNFTSLSSWMYIAIYLYCLIYFHPFVDELTKKGRSVWWVYICMFISFPCFIQKGGERLWEFNMHVIFLFTHICFVYAKRGEEFGELYACLSPYLCIYVCLSLCISLNIFRFIVMYELRGSFYEA